MTPRVLLLLESRATGGVTTIASRLAQELRKRAWCVNEVVIRDCTPVALWAAVRGCDVVLASHNFSPAYVGWILAQLARKPLVVWFHGPVDEVLTQAGVTPSKRSALRWFYRRLPVCVFVSRASKSSLEVLLGPPARGRHYVVPNAVAQCSALAATERSCGPHVELAFVGRLSEEKRPLLLLEAMRLLPDRFRLSMVGDGPLRSRVEDAGADLLAAKRLALLGERSVDAAAYTRWHFTLLASSYEGCPMSLLESLAVGIPCVALPIPALREVLAEHAPSLLAGGMSAHDLAEAVLRIEQIPRPELETQMAAVLREHRTETFIERWQAILVRAAFPC